ncbi:MAG: PA14 domain-containing protein [Alphaproteobacteria bacterium]
MTNSKTHPGSKARSLLAAAVAAVVFAVVPLASPSAGEIAPASPQPKASQLKPGLAVYYEFNYVRKIKWMLYYTRDNPGKPGPPLPQINYSTGIGNVLTSGRADGVMATIVGYIKLAKPGAYMFKVNANDGVRVFLAGKRILDDPDWHPAGDTMTAPVSVQVAKPGWYKLKVLYFERKGTSTLQLYWQPPGAGGAGIVPAGVFAHTAK